MFWIGRCNHVQLSFKRVIIVRRLLSANLCSVSSFPWIALSKAIVLRSRWCACPASKKSSCARSTGSGNKLVKARKQLEAQGRSLMVNHGIEPVKNWWKRRCFATLAVPQWMQELLRNSQPILIALEEKIGALTLQLQAAAASKQPRGLGAMSSVIIDGEIGDWNRFNNRPPGGQLHRLMSRRVQQRQHTIAKLRDQTRQPEAARRAGWNWLGGWSASSPITTRCASGSRSWPKTHWPLEPRAKKQS